MEKRKGGTMFCPKCKSKIGMHLYKCRTPNQVAQGMTCCVCGYWVEKGLASGQIAKPSKSARKR